MFTIDPTQLRSPYPRFIIVVQMRAGHGYSFVSISTKHDVQDAAIEAQTIAERYAGELEAVELIEVCASHVVDIQALIDKRTNAVRNEREARESKNRERNRKRRLKTYAKLKAEFEGQEDET